MAYNQQKIDRQKKELSETHGKAAYDPRLLADALINPELMSVLAVRACF